MTEDLLMEEKLKEEWTNQPEQLMKYQDEYSDSKFWEKLKCYATKAGATVVYCALLLYYVMKSSQVSVKDKALILGALGYLILPFDFVPDFIPMAGYADDAAALIACYQMVKASITPEIEEQAMEKLRTWFGNDITLPNLNQYRS